MGVKKPLGQTNYDFQGTTIPYQEYSREGNAANALVSAFNRLLGRGPTAQEIAKYLPAYTSGDPNIPNSAAGDAEIANLASQQTQSFTPTDKEYKTVNDAFQSTIGRGATQAEADHFGTMIKNGSLDSYSLGTWLQQLPESVQKQDAAFRTGLKGDLESSDAQYYKEQILPAIQSAQVQAGGGYESSPYANSLALAAQSQNRERDSFLSNLSAQQYGGSQANARTDYLNAQQRGYGLADQANQRQYDYSMYDLQKQAYDQYLQRYGKRSGGGMQSGLQGAMSGAVAGGMAGGPWGALAGGIGGGLLGGFGGQ